MATKTAPKPTKAAAATIQAPVPVLKVTRYDTVSTTLVVIVVALAVAVAMLILIWMSHHKFAVAPSAEYSMQFVENPGGFLDGTLGETLGGADGPPAQFSDVESAPEMDNDPDYQEMETIPPDPLETMENVTAAATTAPPKLAQMLPRNAPNVGQRNEGMNYKQKGTGRKGLGDGPGVGGFGREQRWFVRFDEGGTLDEYAKQLDFFGIELGAIMPEGVLIYLSNLAAAKPTDRRVTASEDEKRLYMYWQTQTRKKVDVQLFQKAGIDVNRAFLVQFYPPETEQKLAEAEYAYRKRDAKKIAKTYFAVRPDPATSGYKFVVVTQVPIE